MYEQLEKPKENKSRTVVKSVTQKKSNGKQGFGFVDNRPEGIAERIKQLKSNVIIQRAMSDEEKGNLWAWLGNGATDYLESYYPGRIDDAPMSTCIRLRWFGVSISGADYTVGLNIHYGGNSGGLWIINEATRDVLEAHPNKPPQHGLKQFIENMMPIHVMGWDQNEGTNYTEILQDGH